MYTYCLRCGQYQKIEDLGSYCSNKSFELSICGACWLCKSTIEVIIKEVKW